MRIKSPVSLLLWSSLFILLFASALTGCKSQKKTSLHDRKHKAETSELADEARARIDDFQGKFSDWYLLNERSWSSSPHDGLLVDTYANYSALQTYGAETKARRKAAVALRSWRSSLKQAEGPTMYMLKLSPGYDAEFSDWFYASVSSTGEFLLSGNSSDLEVQSRCISCHVKAEDTDFLFGVPREGERRRPR